MTDANTSSRLFHLGDILSITTGRLVSPRLMVGVHDILDYITGEKLFTHQLPRACEECRPYILMLYPMLATVVFPTSEAATWRAWLDTQVKRYGDTLPIAPLPERPAQYDRPVADMTEMIGDPTKVIAVDYLDQSK